VIIPGVLGYFTRRNIGSTGSVPFIVVGVVVSTICEQLVILSGLIPCIRAIPIRVIRISFISLIAMVRTRELVATIVVVVTRSIGRDELRNAVCRVKGPLIIGIGRTVVLMGQTGQSTR
jgi:hypothetical protein